ncbi:hypothetical protein N7471_007021 [Penicillium samsonianum]|uniref:uncharacterized protein n=1 Tax=Penicillium samsonianum TaxID=1882272 RepID=UPI002547AE69|nr:uncharacterized protein N7471_007021 [Penicillium samsonianum]KAJ6131806.1 hypothetical protein N7471_007021 [Penicillium samsonianum]
MLPTVVKADKSGLAGLQHGDFSAHHPCLHLWVTSNPNTEDHMNPSRNGTNDPTPETQNLNTCDFGQHDINQHRH